MTDFQRPTGTQDVLPDDQAYWRWILATARDVAGRYGCRPIDIPIYEHTELFARGVGTGTDIVEKEMFTFRPRPESEQLTLRPEFTAGIMRAYLQNGMGSWPQPVRLVTFGPVFRYERPQANRFRQHSQFNVEIIGEADPVVDFEVMSLLWDYFSALGLTGLRFQLNSIGSPQARRSYVADVLVPYLERRRAELPEIDIERLAKNPLRVLDSKEPGMAELLAGAPQIADHLCDDCRDHFADVRGLLDELDQTYTINFRLVRGIDYYTKTVFEVWQEGIGAQAALCGGGRYDGLAEDIGGPATPGVGFGSGIERIVLGMKEQGVAPPDVPPPPVYLAHFGGATKTAASQLAFRLRAAGIGARVAFTRRGRSLKSQMREADHHGARYVLIVGGDELAEGVVTARLLASGEQTRVPVADLVPWLQSALNA